MNLDQIVQELTAERDRINTAINVLQQGSAGAPSGKRRGRPPLSKINADVSAGQSASAPAVVPQKRPGRPPLTPAQRKAMSEKMKLAWANRKKQAAKAK